jgi:hypothetical protein
LGWEDRRQKIEDGRDDLDNRLIARAANRWLQAPEYPSSLVPADCSHVALQEPTHLIERRIQLSRLGVAQVLTQDQIIPALLK